jgi:hypothetical protein
VHFVASGSGWTSACGPRHGHQELVRGRHSFCGQSIHEERPDVRDLANVHPPQVATWRDRCSDLGCHGRRRESHLFVFSLVEA